MQGRKENWFDLANLHFMFFDRSEICIRAFVGFINCELMYFGSSSLTFYVFRIFSFYKIKNQELKSLKFENGHLRFPIFRNFSNCQIFRYEK